MTVCSTLAVCKNVDALNHVVYSKANFTVPLKSQAPSVPNLLFCVASSKGTRRCFHRTETCKFISFVFFPPSGILNERYLDTNL